MIEVRLTLLKQTLMDGSVFAAAHEVADPIALSNQLRSDRDSIELRFAVGNPNAADARTQKLREMLDARSTSYDYWVGDREIKFRKGIRTRPGIPPLKSLLREVLH